MNATEAEKAGNMMDETVAYERRTPPPAAARPGGFIERADQQEPEVSVENDRRRGPRFTFRSGDRPLDGYTIKRAIGRGGFGEVYQATSDSGKVVALKLLTRNVEIERRGVQHCMNLKSPHLITVFDLRSNDEGETFVLMEYISGPSLASILEDHPKGLPQNEVRHWLKGLVAGVEYLHDHGIVHRDLKPANLFLEDGVVKIGDYGLSKSINHSQDAEMSENVGTCYYMAPEISSGKYHKPIDTYAMGVIIHEMLTGKVPFEGETTQEVLMKHLTALPDLSAVEEPYRSIIRRALAKDPAHRPSRLVDLLLPEDAPRVADLRYVEKDGASARPTVLETEPKGERAGEDLYVIGHEAIDLYIGPDTMPPPAPAARRRGFDFLARAARRRRSAPTRSPTPAPRYARGQQHAPAPVRPPDNPPPPPPPLPDGRLRLAELAGSMLWAAPTAALASAIVFPAYESLGIRLPQDPLQLAFLFAMILLGTWLVLIAGKLWEERESAGLSLRLGYLTTGIVAGLLGVGIAAFTGMHPSPPLMSQGFEPQLVSWAPAATRSLGFATYFGLVYAACPWWSLTSRARPSRFRFWPIVKIGFIAGIIGLFWPGLQPWSLVVVLVIAVLAQVVSPWSREASAYAREARRSRGRLAA